MLIARADSLFVKPFSTLRSGFVTTTILIVLISIASLFPYVGYTKADTITSTYRVVSNTASVAPGTLGSVQATCNPGDFATGGGPTTSVGGGGESLALASSFGTPTGAPTGWTLNAYNPTSVSLNLAAVVTCMRPVTIGGVTTSTYQVIQSTMSVSPGTLGSSQANCNTGDFATGGGSDTSHGTGDVSLAVASSFPTGTAGGTPTGWTLNAYNPTSQSLNLGAVVVCMKPLASGSSVITAYIMRGTVVSVAPGSHGVTNTLCSSGDFPTGGGSDTSHTTGGGSLAVSDSFPTPAGPLSGWRVDAFNPTTTSLNLASDVVCMTPVTVGGVITSTYLKSFTGSVSPGAGVNLSVSCNSGDFATGGGFNSGVGTINSYGSFPTGPSGNPTAGWAVNIFNPTSTAASVTVTAVCMTPVTVGGATTSTYLKSFTGSVSPGAGVNLSVSCNSGDFATGGGFSSGSGQVHSYGSRPTLTAGTPTGWSVNILNPTSTAQSVTVTAVCMTPITVRGVATSTYAMSTSGPVPAGTGVNISTSCNAGDFTTSGGFGEVDSRLNPYGSFPTGPSGNPTAGWAVNMFNPTSTAASVTVTAVCMTPAAVTVPSFGPGDALIIDPGAGTGGDGALFRVSASGDRTVMSDFGNAAQGPTGLDPVYVALDGLGRPLVMDHSAGTGGHGALFLVTPSTGARTILSDFGSGANPGVNPRGISVDNFGRILVVDPGAGTSGKGALFMVNPSAGTRTVVSDFGNAGQGPLGSNIIGVAIAVSGSIFVVDRDVGTGFNGAVFKVDPSTGARTLLSDFGNAAQGPLGVDPIAAAIRPDGEILVTDEGAGSGGHGAMFVVSPVTGARILRSDFGNAVQGPIGVGQEGIAVSVSVQSILVTDFAAGTGGKGLLFSVDPFTGVRSIISDFGDPAQGPRGVIPVGVAVAISALAVVRGTDNGVYWSGFFGGSWSAWGSLSGKTIASPTLCRSGPNNFDLLVVGEDHAIYDKRFSGGWGISWSSAGGITFDQPACAVFHGVLHVVVRGADSGIWENTRPLPSGAWTGWTSLGGLTSSAPVLLSSEGWAVAGSEGLDLIVRGMDNGIYHKSFAGGAWSASWDSPGGLTVDAPAGIVALSGACGGGPFAACMFVVVRGTDQGVYLNNVAPGSSAWVGWTPLAGSTSSGPSLARDFSRVDLLVTGSDSTPYHKRLAGLSLTWDSPGGSTTSSPAASFVFQDSTENLALIVRGSDNGIYYNTRDGSTWAGWTNLGGATLSTPAVSSLAFNRA